MKIKIIHKAMIGLCLASSLSMIANAQDFIQGYYVGANIMYSEQRASDILLTSPRVERKIFEQRKDEGVRGSVQFGVLLPENIRAELEYTFPYNAEYISRWSPFDANENRNQVRTQRFMLNVYKAFPVQEQVSIYGTAGLGVGNIESKGWQGNASREFEKRTHNKFTYSVGVGVEYAFSEDLALDIAYRYIDYGNIKTNRNTFVNRVNARDEQLHADLSEHNISLGIRKSF